MEKMMTKIGECLAFKGKWRAYQERVLNRASMHLEDEKIHIVAAPGSGKTTLGIELIKRIGENCLVLTPSITIRDQWLSRIADGFLIDASKRDALLSNDLRHPKPITAVTYQAVHSSMQRAVGEEDFSDIDLVRLLKENNIKTLCLDEAHHMRNEWVRSLESLLANFKGMKVISLTATPPYDVTPTEWNRYIELCGPIDEEIFTPELVKEKSLCPHQDYIYFNFPTEDEKKVINEHKENVQKCMSALMDLADLESLIRSNQALKNPTDYADALLENPRYMYALIIYMNQKQIAYPSQFDKLLDSKKNKLPVMNVEYMEGLLKGIFDSIKNERGEYVEKDPCVKTVKELVKKHGCMYRNDVVMTKNNDIQRTLVNSKGKLESMCAILEEEHQSLGKDLRMLVLCDYIKKESVSLIGSSQMITEIGTVPVFEKLRKTNITNKIAVLSGGLTVIPKEITNELIEILKELGYESKTKELAVDDFVVFETNADNGVIVKLITQAFEKGQIEVLIGTKALLGEGWDSPCINALIMASFVGSYVLSNQMRGRAIRKDPNKLDKVSNVWHLVCIDKANNGVLDHFASYDLRTLERRFNTFLGVHYEQPIIETGIGRVSYLYDGINKLDKKDVGKINKKMLEAARNRDALREKWENSLEKINPFEPVEEGIEVDTNAFNTMFSFVNYWGYMLASIVSMLLTNSIASIGSGVRDLSLARIGVISLIWAMLAVFLYKLFDYIGKAMTPQRNLKRISKAILHSLKELKLVGSNTMNVRISKTMIKQIQFVNLDGGTTKEKGLFVKCLQEFLAPIENQRYMIVRKWAISPLNKYFAVPEAFAKNKNDANVFQKNIKHMLGKYELVYTRNPDGRKRLLRARACCFGYQNEKIINSKKRALGKYE